MESGKALYVITQIASLFSKDPTTLRQEMPYVCPPSIEQVVPYLDLKDSDYSNLVKEGKKHIDLVLNDEKSEKKQKDNQIIRPNTILASLIHYVDQPLNTLEKNIEEQIKTTINDAIDEVDQVSIQQVTSLGQKIWEYIGPWVKKSLVEGALFSCIDKQQFQKASELSYLNFFYHESSLRIQRRLLLLAPSCYVTRKKDDIIRENERETYKNFWLWHHRWYDTHKMNNKLHHLYNLQSFYQEKFLEAIEVFKHEQNKENPDIAMQENFASLAYHYLSQRNIIIDATCELQTAHHNKLAKNRDISWFDAFLENGLNAIAGWFYQFGYFRMPRSFEVCLDHCEKLIQEGSEAIFEYNLRLKKEDLKEEQKKYLQKELLLVNRKRKAKIDELLPHYITAITEDNFFKAKELCTWYVTEDSQFNWVEEYQHFENYRRELSKIFQYQDLFNDILERLYQLGDHYYPKEAQLYNKIIGFQDKVKRQIIFLHQQHRELKKSFINLIETHSNTADKGIIERISNSLGRKALRYLTEGKINHSIEPYTKQLKLIHEQIQHSTDLLTQIKFFVIKKSKIDEKSEERVQEIKKYFNEVHLTPLHYQEAFMPFIITKEAFHSYFTETLQLDDLSNMSEVKILGANILRNIDWNGAKIWGELSTNFKTYIQFIRAFQKQQKQLKDLYKTFIASITPVKENLKYQNTIALHKLNLEQALKKLNSFCSQLQKSFIHTVITIYNQHTPLDSGRVLASAGRKAERLLTTGEISNSTPLLRDLECECEKQYSTTLEFIQKFQKQIEKWQHLSMSLSQQKNQQVQTVMINDSKVVIDDNYM